ncbi:MAG: uroporphyrinogen decarboxylase family protein [Pseudomonadota bacterium]
MNPNELLTERLEICNDAVRMKKKPKRVPFITLDAFWRYHDSHYKLSEALMDYRDVENACIKFQNRYQFDSFLDIGDRNPLQVTRSLGNFEYRIDDDRNTLVLRDQCFFNPEDYDLFAQNPVKTLWENVLTRKYTLFNKDTPLETLMGTVGKFIEYTRAMSRISERLATECGMPPLFANMHLGVAIECLYNFFRGIKGLALDLRRCPDKITSFIEVFHTAFVKPQIEGIVKIDKPATCFSRSSPMLAQNLLGRKDFEKFYWPQFKEITDKIVATDNTLFLLSEGTTKHITEFLQELPKGHFCMLVDMDDIFETRKRLPNMCLMGGIPLFMLGRASKEQVIDRAKKVIDEVGSEGGVILSTDKFPSSSVDCNRDNLLALSEFVRNYR